MLMRVGVCVFIFIAVTACAQTAPKSDKDYAALAQKYGITLEKPPASALSPADIARIQALEAQVAAEAARREKVAKEERIAEVVGGCVVLATGLFLAFFFRKKLIPSTARGKQSLVLFLVALWCSGCCLYAALARPLMNHPVDAVAKALLLSMPALLFGAVAFWAVSNPVAPPNDRLDTEAS